MKKSKIIGLTFISALLVFSLTNVSHAAVPSYVGINAGDSYHWIGSVNMASVNSTAIGFIGAANWTLIYDMLDEQVLNETGLPLGSLLAGEMKVNIINMTPEIPLLTGLGVMLYAELSVSNLPGVWDVLLDASTPMLSIQNPVGIDSTNYLNILGGGFGLFIPKGLNFNQIATWMTSNLTGFDPIYNNVTVSALANGFQATILGAFLDWSLNMSGAPITIPSLSDIVVTANWNSNGVFSNATLKYGGVTFVSVELLTEELAGEIPGFIIPIFLGVGAIAIVGTISIIKRKKRII